MTGTFRRAWRNLWRNPRRSAITLAAVGLNTVVLIASLALMDGLFAHTLRNATGTFTGEVQVHAPGWLEDRSLYRRLENPDAVLAAAHRAGADAAPRVYGYGLLAQGSKSAGALLAGVDPEAEWAAFGLAGHLSDGRFLSAGAGREIVLGHKLARSLQAPVGAEVVLVVQAADGSMGNDLYRVAGIFGPVGEAFDRGTALVHQTDFRELFVLPEAVHEVAVDSDGRVPAEDLAAAIRAASPGDEARTWKQLLPLLADMLGLFDASMALFAMIFGVAAGLGVLNTMLMATYERTREFGLLKALGTSPWGVVLEVSAEALVLGMLASALGAILGVAATGWLQEVGIDTTALAGGPLSFGGVAFDPVWKAQLGVRVVAVPVLSMWLVCVLAALYPAARAARLDPVLAMREA